MDRWGQVHLGMWLQCLHQTASSNAAVFLAAPPQSQLSLVACVLTDPTADLYLLQEVILSHQGGSLHPPTPPKKLLWTVWFFLQHFYLMLWLLRILQSISQPHFRRTSWASSKCKTTLKHPEMNRQMERGIAGFISDLVCHCVLSDDRSTVEGTCPQPGSAQVLQDSEGSACLCSLS